MRPGRRRLIWPLFLVTAGGSAVAKVGSVEGKVAEVGIAGGRVAAVLHAAKIPDCVRVRHITEDDSGRLAVESARGVPRNFLDGIVEKYGLEYFHDKYPFVFGWVPGENVRNIVVERRDLCPGSAAIDYSERWMSTRR